MIEYKIQEAMNWSLEAKRLSFNSALNQLH